MHLTKAPRMRGSRSAMTCLAEIGSWWWSITELESLKVSLRSRSPDWGPALSAHSRTNSTRKLLLSAAPRVQSCRSPTRRSDQWDRPAFTTPGKAGPIADLSRFPADEAYGLTIAARPWLLSVTESSVALPPVWSVGMTISYSAQEYTLLYL